MSDTSVKREKHYDPIFHSTPLTLQQFASRRIVLHLCVQNSSNFDLAKNNASQIEAPVQIRNIIESSFDSVTAELDYWFNHSNCYMYHVSSEDIRDRSNLVVFGGNGTVHFKDTIANFLEDSSLSEMTRFEMACVFCVKEKLDHLWPSVCDMIRIDYLYLDNPHNLMINYWICAIKGKLKLIPLSDFDRVEHLMIDICSWHPIWLAVEYFLSLLDSDDRLDRIDAIFECSGRSQFVKHLLPYLEGSLQRDLMDSKGISILSILTNSKLVEYTLQAWMYVRDFITGEDYFHYIVERFDYVRDFRRDTSAAKYTYTQMILSEIWVNTPVILKQHILQYHFARITRLISRHEDDLTKNLHREITFLLTLLNDADVDLRKYFWNECWQYYIVGVPSAQLLQLFEVCLFSNDAVEEFKTKLKHTKVFHDYCDMLVTRGYGNELNEFLSVICSDTEEVLSVKINILKANYRWKECIFEPDPDCVNELQVYAEFIDEVLSDEFAAKNLKKELILSNNNVNILLNKINPNNFSNVEIIFDLFLPEQNLVQYKNLYLSKFHDTVTNGEFRGFDE